MLKTFHYNRKKDGSMLINMDMDIDNVVINLSRVTSLNFRGRLCDRYLQHIMTFLKESQVEKLNFDKFFLENEGAKVVAKGLKFTNITWLYVRHNQIKGENATYLSDIVKQTSLTYLDISWNLLGDEGMKYLAEGLKNSNIITLFVGNNAIKIDGMKYLVDVLPYTKITRLDLNQNKYADGNYNEMGDEGIEYLSKQLEYSNISNLNLDWNQISSDGVKCLSEHLEKTCITFLSLNCNKLDKNAEQYLMSILPKTQIAGINAIPYFSSVDKFIKTTLQCHISSNNTRESKVKYVFLKLVAQNPQTHDLEFIIPERTKDIDLTEYIYIMKEFNKNPMVKGYIFDLIRKNNCANYPRIIEKVNKFVALIRKKSIEFIEKIWPLLMKSSINNDFLNIVKEFENAELGEVVQYLLLHRVLFYVDEDAEILHPFIYMMLNKYGMPLYKEQIEPAKKEKIIAFFETHNEIEYAQEIIDLLKSKS